MNRSRTVLFAVAALATPGCFETLDTSPEAVEADIRAALKPGDPAEAIEEQLRERGITFSYDRFANRYQAIIRHPESNFHAITIHIELDQQKRFVGVDAADSYTLW